MGDVLFTQKKGFLLPSRDVVLTSQASFDLATMVSAVLAYKPNAGGTRQTTTVTLVDAPSKTVRVAMTSGLVGTLGHFPCQIEVTFPTGVMCFPDEGFDEFVITETIE
jgi:hypothetical protein